MKSINILMIGSDISVNGGMSSVIKQILDHNWSNNTKMKYIPTHINKNSVYKSAFFLISLVKIIFSYIFDHIDIVHMHMSYKGSFFRKYIVFKLSLLFRVKVLIHLHGSEFKKFYCESNKLIQFLIKDMMKNSSKVMVLGENWKNFIEEIEPKSKVEILLNTISIPKETVSYSSENIRILFLGALVKRKGIFELIDAINNMKNQLPLDKHNVKFIIGGSGSEEEKIKYKIQEYKLDQYIELVGWINGEEKTRLIQSCQIFVLPSHNEGLPIAILEAISYGMPVVSTKVGSIDECVYDNYNGFLIEPNNTKQIEDALTCIIKSPELWHTFSINSRNLAVDKFDETNYFEKINKVYIELKG